jgi:hypothetical protein
MFCSFFSLQFFPFRSLSENNNKTAMIATTIADTTDNAGIRLIDSPFAEVGAIKVVGAGKVGPVEGAVDGMGAGIDVVCGVEDDCDTCPDGK